MKKDLSKSKTRARPRRKIESAPTPVPTTVSPEAASSPRNVGAFESAFSLALGVLFLVGALFPRSIKQLLLLGLGGGLVYRGMTSDCGVYRALGLDSENGSVINQINEKYLAGPSREKH